MNCVILDDYQNVATTFADWNSLDNVSVTNFTEKYDERMLVKKLKNADIIVVMRERTTISRAFLEQLPSLKLIVTSGMRNAAIDLAAAKAQGIVVCGTRSLKQPPMELAWGLILNLSRQLHQEASAFKSGGPWQSTVGIGLYGKTLGLLGLGYIGQLMVPVAKAFGMKVIAWSPNLTTEKCQPFDVAFTGSKAALFTNADIVSIHMVLSHATKNLVDHHELALMRPDALLINTSRAEIVNQQALVATLSSNSISGAGLDVFDTEPLPLDHPFRSLPNVLATPHLGYVENSNYRIYFSEAVENIQAFLNHAPVRTLQCSAYLNSRL